MRDFKTLQLGQRVEKLGSEKDYATGRRGEVVEIPGEDNAIEPDRVRVKWDTNPSGTSMKKKYPRVMWVWNNLDEEGLAWKRKVICKAENKFITVEFGQSYSYNYAKDIEPEIEVTLEEIAAWKGVSVEQVKIKK